MKAIKTMRAANDLFVAARPHAAGSLIGERLRDAAKRLERAGRWQLELESFALSAPDFMPGGWADGLRMEVAALAARAEKATEVSVHAVLSSNDSALIDAAVETAKATLRAADMAANAAGDGLFTLMTVAEEHLEYQRWPRLRLRAKLEEIEEGIEHAASDDRWEMVSSLGSVRSDPRIGLVGVMVQLCSDTRPDVRWPLTVDWARGLVQEIKKLPEERWRKCNG